MSTDDAGSSSTGRRLCCTGSEFVWTSMPASTLREHAGTRTRAPSSSTTQTRHTLTGVRLSSWQSVGVSTPRRRQASRMVEPSVTSTSRPSMVMPTSFLGMPTKTASDIEYLQLRETGSDRIRGGLTEAADRSVPHGLRDVAEKHHIRSRAAVALREHPLQDLLLALRPHPTRHTLTTRLVAEEARDAEHGGLHIGGVVEDDDGARPKPRPAGAGALQAPRHIEFLPPHQRTRPATQPYGLRLSRQARQLEQLAERGPHLNLAHAPPLDMPGDP